MKASILGLVAAAAIVATSAPAMAQPWNGGHRGQAAYGGHAAYGGQLNSGYVDSLEWKINNAAREGRLPWRQARGLLSELRQVQGPLVHRVETGQASRREHQRLASVVSRIEAAVNSYPGRGRGDRGYGDNRRYDDRGYGYDRRDDDRGDYRRRY